MNDKQTIIQLQKDVKELQEKVAALSRHECMFVSSASPHECVEPNHAQYGQDLYAICRICGKPSDCDNETNLYCEQVVKLDTQ